MQYTKISKEFIKEYYGKFSPKSNIEIHDRAKKDPVIFAYYFLNVKLRIHQAYAIDKILRSKTKRVAFCWARQLGKSISLGIFLVWATWYNKYPSTVAKITTTFIVSTNDEAAMELISKIRDIIIQADLHMGKVTTGTKTQTEDYFSRFFKEPNNTHQITWSNGSFIKSVAPTKKVLGKSASIFIIDEAANLDNEDPDNFYKKVVTPTVAETGGFIIISSTPEGISGFFHDEFDPDDRFDYHEFERIWFSYLVYNDQGYQERIERERVKAEQEGKIKTWQQQFMAMFTVTESSFFDLRDLEASLENTPEHYEWKKTPCAVGYDYGIKHSRTVITIRTKIGNKIIQLFQYRCPPGLDINKLIDEGWEHSIQNLKKRYNLELGIISDDCAQGDMINRWFESNSELPVRRFNFRSDQMSKTDGLNRNCTWYSYRAKLKEGILKLPLWNERQLYEMKIVQEIEQKILITIKAPIGQLCDCCDSDMMASIPFLDMSSVPEFSYEFDETKEEIVNHSDPSFDYFPSLTAEEIKERFKQGDYDSLTY